MTNRIRIKSRIIDKAWTWELITADGHVVDESRAFEDRYECEADALRQGMPIVGLSKRSRKSPAARVANHMATWEFVADSHKGLWRWQQFSELGEPIASSMTVFLTRSECIADARLHGYTGACHSEKRMRLPE